MRTANARFTLILVLVSLGAVAGFAACAPTTGAPVTESLVVYQDAPTMQPLDVGESGTSPGDAYYFFADLHSEAGGPVIGEVFGTKTLVKPAVTENPDTEQRATLLFFTFGDRTDQIVVAGVPDYPVGAPEFNANQTTLRAVLGGTGKYMGRAGN